MNDVQKFDLKNAGAWLSSEVDIRVKRKWLVAAAAVVVCLMFIALD